MLYAVSYSFLLRVRDEGLPIRVGEIADWERVPKEDHSAFWVTGDELVLVLAKRKNRRRPTRLVRHCWCARRSRAELCPVHTIGSWLSALPRGATPFAELSGARALADLRRRLAVLGEAEPERFRLHSFRGGHAMDVAQNGGRLVAQILKAGDWRSPAFTAYLNASELETQVLAISSHASDHISFTQAVLDARLAASDEECTCIWQFSNAWLTACVIVWSGTPPCHCLSAHAECGGMPSCMVQRPRRRVTPHCYFCNACCF